MEEQPPARRKVEVQILLVSILWCGGSLMLGSFYGGCSSTEERPIHTRESEGSNPFSLHLSNEEIGSFTETVA